MNNRYKAQIDDVLHYVYGVVRQDWTMSDSGQFDEAVLIDTLALKACMSKRNFHLYFKLYTTETVKQFIKRIRLEHALLLIQEGTYTQAEIAERIGLANDTALYNIFKKKYDYTPSEYSQLLLSKSVPYEKIEPDYHTIQLQETPVLYLSYIGNYDQFAVSSFEEDSWEQLYAYANSKDLLPNVEEYWGICFDDIAITDSDKCRFYACLTIKSFYNSKLTNPIKCMTIPAGLYAKFLHKGAYAQLDNFYNSALDNIPLQYSLGEGFILERYINSPENTPEEQLETEVLLPIIKN